jgi:transcriptional regulator with XRE-family HTH domain
MQHQYSEEEKEILINFGKRIRTIREGSGLSQEKLAFESGLDRTYIGSVERGERNISLLNINKVATALKIESANLFNGEK